MIAFAAIALVLALVGTYGAFWYAVSERTRELGVRVALGATPRDIVSRVLGASTRLAVAGLAIGLALALAATRLLRSLLFETSPTDPVVLAVVTAGFLAAVLFATWIPARRASRANPVEALRDA
jgi:ABC-type antimicrobial peptide transport system permease subunit